jgi:hypothetical protein
MAPFGDDLPEQQPDYAFWQTAIEMGNLGSGREVKYLCLETSQRFFADTQW